MPEYDHTKVGRTCIECGYNFLSRFPWRRCLPCRKALRASLRYEIYLKYVPVAYRATVARILVGKEWAVIIALVYLIFVFFQILN